jgi:methyltransferase family protein
VPMSSEEGKDWTRTRIHELADRYGPLSVLDVGPGVGTYARLLAGPDVRHIVGLEVWEPYLTTYHLADYYDELVVGDVRTTPLPEVDVVILGDVLEHMSRAEAVEVWRRAAEAARLAVYLSMPIVHYPQHEIEGNPFEVHVEEDWDEASVAATFEGIGATFTGTEVGVFERLVDVPASGPGSGGLDRLAAGDPQ